jgi:L-ascorbate metabolism protein UlaG (beta-lactamase superfamily)
MDPDEAARAAEMLGVEHAIPCHFIAPTADLAVFVERCRHHDSSGARRISVPVVRETVDVEPSLQPSSETGSSTSRARTSSA